jgi:hypothetical protein
MAFGIPDTMEMRTGYEYMDRLYSPDEFQELPGGVQLGFNGYMDYVNKFQYEQKKRQREGTPGTQRVNQGGGSFGAVGQPITYGRSGSGGTGGATSKGGSAIPRYRTKTDIRGNVTFEPTGGKRTIDGEYIPTSLEDVQNVESLRYAVPTIQANTEANYLTAANNLAVQKTYASQNKAQMAQERLRQQGQGVDQRGQMIDIAQQKADQTNQRFYDGLDAKTKLVQLSSDLRKGLIERTYELKGMNDSDREQFRFFVENAKGNIPNTPESIAKNREYAQRAMQITDNAFKNAITMEDKKEAFSAQRDIRNYISRLNVLENSVYGSAKADVQGKQANATSRLDFTSEEEARSYGKKSGDIVIINGRKAQLN